jgi:DNA-directed RNA polymerase specialized sigma24 family protein
MQKPTSSASQHGVRVETFEELFEREYRSLAGYRWNLVGDREAVADIAQESFARLLAAGMEC